MKSQLVYSVEAGIVNATGYAWVRGPEFDVSGSSGGLYTSAAPDNYGRNHATGQPSTRFNLDLSRSNSLYGNSNTVTPLSRRTVFLIRY